MRPLLFDADESRALSPAEIDLLNEAYAQALVALKKNLTPIGFSACALLENTVTGTDVNYRSVWSRDGSMTVMWTLDLQDEDVRICQEATLRTLLANQSRDGQIPSSISIDSGAVEFAGLGGITSIDGGMWLMLAVYEFCDRTGRWDFAKEHADNLDRLIRWLRAHDSNNCGLLEIPEAGDWTDLFARSYHILYDEVLWYRSVVFYGRLLERWGDAEQADEYRNLADHIRRVVLRNFWPRTSIDPGDAHPSFSEVQFRMGDAKYLVAEISPFNYSWRCDVFGNILAFLTGLVDPARAMMTFRFLWGVGINEPGPVKCLYPPVQAGDREWKDYFTVNILNLPNHYHNGGIWPFIGALWVRYISRLGMSDIALRELVNLAKLCSQGASYPWEFNEWHHGVTGRPMGKAFQAWSAAGFIRACHGIRFQSSDSLGSI
jgi:glycogen debranching enzyme